MPQTLAPLIMAPRVDPATWIVLGLVVACAVMAIGMRMTNNVLTSTREVNRDRKAAARLYLVLHDLAEEHPAFVTQASALREGRTAKEWAHAVERLALTAGLPDDVLADVLEECRDGVWSDDPILDRRTAHTD